MSKAVFFDRDGVINKDYGYVGDIASFDFVEGIKESLAKLRSLGYILILVTNQSGIARGRYSEADFMKVTAFMQQVLAIHNAQFDGIYYCPHHPTGQIEKYRCDCDCRKPKEGMFKKAQLAFGIDAEESICIGDRARDLQGAAKIGVKKLILVGTNAENEQKQFKNAEIFNSVKDFVDNLSEHQNGR